MMQLMLAKGMLHRDGRQRVHVYWPCRSEVETQRQLVGDLARRAFAGSAKNLALQALSPRKASAEEMARIRRLLDQIVDKP
jgi:predicted transcriptional regulator